MKLIFLAGLPACGKTSWAKEYQKNNPGTKRVNKDDLRSMIDDSVWSKSNEKTILSIQQSIVSDLLNKHDVILDNTHLDKKHEEE
jgi:tRNA uridine 5-carbamoylmethylation protein Kti12